MKHHLTGQTFGRLTVLEYAGPYINALRGQSAGAYVWVGCSCGSPTKRVRASALTGGQTKSCGCLRRDLTRDRNKARRGWEQLALPF